MSETKAIRAVDLVRRIRDEQAGRLAGRYEAEVIQFFKRAWEGAKKAAEERLSGKGESRRGAQNGHQPDGFGRHADCKRQQPAPRMRPLQEQHLEQPLQ